MKKNTVVIIIAAIGLCVLTLAVLGRVILLQMQAGDQIDTLSDYLKKPVWSFTAVDRITSTPAQDGNKIFLRTSTSVIALDAMSGKLLWRVASMAEADLTLAPVIVEEYLVVSEEFSRVVVINKESGEVIWRSEELDKTRTDPRTTKIQSIVTSDNILYVSRDNWYLIAYDLQSGHIIWKQDLPSHTTNYLATSRSAVIVSSGNLLSGYDAQTGAISWAIDLKGYLGFILVDRDNDILFVVIDDSPGLLAIDLRDRHTLWEKKLVELEPFEINCVIKHGDVLYVAAKELLALSSLNGEQVGKTSKTGRLECPVIRKDKLFVRNTGSSLYGFDIASLQQLGRLTVQFNTPMLGEPDRGPIVSGELIIIPITDNEIYAYQPE